ncbi:MAG: DUF4261 domain-containing protein [Actinomycetaceae bacterium]|nr:DUF4261 domain-containing protein [Arcanobacterium sp.]MDD7687613.1 DUF4261 domain-containing protein [Actinomycetaceae bacterium]MDY5273149.1 DUF4261 domain-containing protein [Arcanobacterium sp.]
MEQLGVSAIHPTAPQFLSAVLLSREEIDIERGIGRLNSLWKVGAEPAWDRTSDGSPLLHFAVAGAQVMLTQLSGSFTPKRGTLPQHSYYTAITIFIPPSRDDAPHEPDTPHPSGTHAATSTHAHATENTEVVTRRRHMVTAHIVLTQLADALGRSSGVVGLFREELGVVQPPQMFAQLAPLLAQGQVPLPLWVNIRAQPLAAHADRDSFDTPDKHNDVSAHDAESQLTLGRTFGLPLFGHLDLQVSESIHSPEEVYAELANIATYLITTDSYLLPGQTLGSSEGEQIALTQALSEIDHTPVIEILY